MRFLSSVLPALGLFGLIATAPAPALAQSEGGPGSSYIAAAHGDWELRCIRGAEGMTAERCEMFQFLRDDEGNDVAVVRFNMPIVGTEGQAATAIFNTPLQTRLDAALRIRIDDGEFDLLPFTFCTPSGCAAESPLNEEVVDQFKAGGDATIVIFALLLNQNGEPVRGESGEPRAVPVELVASLRGFTAAYEEMEARHADLRAALAELAAQAEEANQ